MDTEMEDAPLESIAGPSIVSMNDTVNTDGKNLQDQAVMSEAISLQDIEQSIITCDQRIAEYIVQITKINESNPVLANELREKQKIQIMDRKNFADARKRIMKDRNESSWLSSKVPPGLPKLQWIVHTFDGTAAVYPDIGAALREFKDDLIMHCLSPDYHWRRLITASLNTDHRGWLDDLPTNRHITWCYNLARL
ncbi:unnamed protein product [Mucor hiemalis]